MTLEQAFYDAACRVRDRKLAAWQAEQLALDAAVSEADAAKRAIVGGDYWKAACRAGEQLKSAQRLVEILAEGVS